MATQKKHNTNRNLSVIDKMDAYLEKNKKGCLYFTLILSTIIALLLFDTKVSLSGDDCDYIISAKNFWSIFTYPGHHGPLYPIVLSPFVGFFGMNLILLKMLSLIFMISSFLLFYKCFEKITPAIVLFPALLISAINSHVLFFACYTYSEPLFMLFQAAFFFLFSKYFFIDENKEYTIKNGWKKHLALALFIMAMGLTRTTGFAAIGCIITYFIIQKRWKDIISITSIFTILFLLFYFLKPVIWNDASSVQSFDTLFAVNPFNLEQGPESITGIIKRFIQNSHIYISVYFYKYLGFRDLANIPLKNIPILTILTYLLFFLSCIFVFRKNKALLFTGIYVGAMLLLNFILLHIMWAQDRFLMVYYPYILIFLFGGLYYFFKLKAFRSFSALYPLILIIVIIATGIHTKTKVSTNVPILQQNIIGNDLYGLTPDWENFIKMSRWANDNLEKDAVIVSRKPSISQVYTNRNFLGIYSIPSDNIANIKNKFNEDKDKYIYIGIEFENRHPTIIRQFIQHLIITKNGNASYSINNKAIKAALLYKIEKDLYSEDLLDSLKSEGFNYTLDMESLLNTIEINSSNTLAYYIDDLVALLKDNNVKYLLLPKIRVYTSENTGRYINTIHQIISMIESKYSSQFILVHSTGKEESCELVEYIGQ
jgi:hypothetical protein